MADGTVRIENDPTGQLIDNEEVVNDLAQTVLRQKVAVVNSNDGPLQVDVTDTSIGADLRVAGAAVTALNPVPVDIQDVTLTIAEPVSVDDNGGSLTVDGPVTDAELRATPVPVSGTVTVAEPVTVDGEVSLAAGTLAALETIQVGNFPATQPVSGPLTDAELRATPVPVSGAVTVSDGSGPLTVDGTVALDAGSLAALETINAVQSGTWSARVTDGTDIAEVNARTDGIVALEVADDFTSFQADHRTLVASTDTTITFAQAVRMVVVHNWDIANRVLVKDGAIGSNTDAASARAGFAPAASVPGKLTLPFKTTTVHVRSAAASEVTIIGFF